ncbi:G-protein-signaling modulator 1 [Lampris incognitus]|uniref:G-protein-signaling modulator 1 n=1 Tax=Lampris incognitus TaxID=2546036 RepID=UPI0024B5867C|nr:G-protein-signaling modulator 1 [Lampris incognitus]
MAEKTTVPLCEPANSHSGSCPQPGSGSSPAPGSSPDSRTRHTSRRRQEEETEDLLELIAGFQSQRMEEQRASITLLPAAPCGTYALHTSPDLPSQTFYDMLILYQSKRMEDQRCSVPELDEISASLPDGQEDFFSLIQRVQSRRLNEQRASLLIEHTETHTDTHTH